MKSYILFIICKVYGLIITKNLLIFYWDFSGVYTLWCLLSIFLSSKVLQQDFLHLDKIMMARP